MNKQQAALDWIKEKKLNHKYGVEKGFTGAADFQLYMDRYDTIISALQSVIDAVEKPLSGQGMVMVPVEPTEEMYHAGYERINESLETGTIATCGDVYKAMIAARPKGE